MMMKLTGGLRSVALVSVTTLFMVFCTQAQTIYHVRAGATGSANGLDWNNAYPTLPTPLKRGATYYVADGSYSGINFNVAGTALISIKKAIQTDHGTNTGWTVDMGDGQASFTSGFTLASGNLLVDGQTGGGPNSWTSGHGFRFNGGTAFYANTPVGNITIQHSEFVGPGLDGNCSQNIEFRVFSGPVPNITLRYNYHRNMSSSVLWINGATDLLWEYNYVADSPSTDACHGEAIYMTGSARAIFRNSMWRNVDGTGVIMVAGDGFKIYGNVIWWDSTGGGTGNGSIGGWSHDHTPTYNCHVYNNTIINGRGYNSGVAFFSANIGGNIVRNNLMVGNQTAYISGVAVNDNNTIDNTTSRFVNYAARDLRLTAALAGAALTAEYNTDLSGNMRGSDGVWDRGAYEFGGVLSTNPVISVSPNSLSFGSIATNTTRDLTFTVQNSGGGTLVGTASVPAPFSILSGGNYSLGLGQSQVVTVRYSPVTSGNASRTVTLTGGGGATVAVTGATLAISSGLSFEYYAGSMTAPFVANTGGGYLSQDVQTGVAGGGRVVFTFAITNAGSYVVEATVNAPSLTENSFFVNIDGEPQEPSMAWDILPPTIGTEQRFLGWRGTGTADANEIPRKVFNLAAGTHQLIIVGREPNTQLSRVAIIKVPPVVENLHVVSSQ